MNVLSWSLMLTRTSISNGFQLYSILGVAPTYSICRWSTWPLLRYFLSRSTFTNSCMNYKSQHINFIDIKTPISPFLTQLNLGLHKYAKSDNFSTFASSKQPFTITWLTKSILSILVLTSTNEGLKMLCKWQF